MTAAQAQVPQDNVVEQRNGTAFATRTTGGIYGALNPATDWNLWSDGYLGQTVAIPNDSPATASTGDPHTVAVTAYGSPAGGVWPNMDIYVDGVKRKSFTVNSASPKTYSFVTNLRAGMRRVQVHFTNNAMIGNEDRNLFVRSLKIVAPNPTPHLPALAGAFNLQSVSILSGLFSSNQIDYGVNTPCSPSLHPGCQNIDFIKALGGNDVTITSVCEIKPGTSECQPQINWNNEEYGLRVAIRYARSKGMSVTLKPFVLSSGGNVPASDDWVPDDPEMFFSSIESNLKRHARIAREEGVSLLMLGVEMGGKITSSQPLNNHCARWRQLISRVRIEAANVSNLPPGSSNVLALTYSPTMVGYWNWLQSNEAPYVCFWDELDYIGLNAYHHMHLTPSSSPRSRLTSGWHAFKRLFDANMPIVQGGDLNFVPPIAGYSEFDLTSKASGGYMSRYSTNSYSTKWYADYVIDKINARFKTSLQSKGKYPLKAILTEVGVPSSPNVHGFWGSWHDGSGYDPSWTVYVDDQARGWDGYLRAFRGDPRIHGISIWGLRPYHSRQWTSTPADILVDYDFNDKVNASGVRVTEEIVCKWFKRGPPTTSPCWR